MDKRRQEPEHPLPSADEDLRRAALEPATPQTCSPSYRLPAAAAPPQRRRVVQRVDDAQITEDWHNDYARLLLGLGRSLEELPDDAARCDLLRRMQDLLPS